MFFRIVKDYLLPVILPGLAVTAFFAAVLLIPFGGFDSGAQLSQVIVNLVDTAVVISLVFILAFSMRYFRARGFYFLLLLIIQMWYLQQGPAGREGAFWTLIFVPFSFTAFLIVSERGLFSPRTRLLLIIIGLPVLFRFLLEQYGGLRLTELAMIHPFREAIAAWNPALSLWSLMFYGAAAVIALLRYIIRPSRDLSAVLWLIAISFVMVFVASASEYPSVVSEGLGVNDLTPDYMFMAPPGVEPALHAFLGLLVFAAAIIEVVTLFDLSYRMAYQDQLTGLPGRRAYDDAIRNLGRKYAIAMVDIDHFKSFNDNYGHDVGDQVLKLVGQVLKNHAKPGTAYRYGGEEFVILYGGAANADVKESAESVRRRISEYPFALRKFLRPPYPPGSGGKPAKKTPKKSKAGGSRGKSRRKEVPKTINVTVSMGLADHRNTDLSPEEVMKKADQALYAAKEQGRNRLVISR